MVGLGLLSVVFVAMLTYSKLQNYHQLSLRYRRMKPVFRQAHHYLQMIGEDEDIVLQQQILRQLGLITLDEHSG